MSDIEGKIAALNAGGSKKKVRYSEIFILMNHNIGKVCQVSFYLNGTKHETKYPTSVLYSRELPCVFIVLLYIILIIIFYNLAIYKINRFILFNCSILFSLIQKISGSHQRKKATQDFSSKFFFLTVSLLLFLKL